MMTMAMMCDDAEIRDHQGRFPAISPRLYSAWKVVHIRDEVNKSVSFQPLYCSLFRLKMPKSNHVGFRRRCSGHLSRVNSC